MDKRVKNGLQVLITEPRCVETGLDLNAFTTLIFYSMGYNLFTLRQASRRSWRINQTAPRVEVYMPLLCGHYAGQGDEADGLQAGSRRYHRGDILGGRSCRYERREGLDLSDGERAGSGHQGQCGGYRRSLQENGDHQSDRKKKVIEVRQEAEPVPVQEVAVSEATVFGIKTADSAERQRLYEGLLARTQEEQKKRKSKKPVVDENQLSLFGFV